MDSDVKATGKGFLGLRKDTQKITRLPAHLHIIW
jgi:hypothetical protein